MNVQVSILFTAKQSLLRAAALSAVQQVSVPVRRDLSNKVSPANALALLQRLMRPPGITIHFFRAIVLSCDCDSQERRLLFMTPHLHQFCLALSLD
jgi:hypothetical protein